MAQTKPRNNCGSKILRSLVEERSNLLVLHCVRLLNRGGPEGQHWSQIRSLIASEILGEDWNQVLGGGDFKAGYIALKLHMGAAFGIQNFHW